LNHYGLDFTLFTNLPRNVYGKLLYIPVIDAVFYRQALTFKPDILVGFAGAYISHVGWLMNRPRIVIDDTEHAKISHLSYQSFASAILTPSCFHKDMGKKQIRFNSYIEFAYLHPNYFKANPEIYNTLSLDKSKKNVLIRFVSWRASHDIGQSGLTLETKIKLVKTLSEYANIMISSEEDLPDDLIKYRYSLKPEQMHDALAAADLFIGEGATMATECAILGTPAMYINSLECGTNTEQENVYGLVYNFRTSDGVIEKALSLIQDPSLKEKHAEKRKNLLRDKIDITAFLLWFMKNYPSSFKTMKENPDFQNKFR
jgi:predicted glycosyltransferase